jgi:hypothetical protein
MSYSQLPPAEENKEKQTVMGLLHNIKRTFVVIDGLTRMNGKEMNPRPCSHRKHREFSIAIKNPYSLQMTWSTLF